MSADRKLKSIAVTDIEKRKWPSKHYVYVIVVQWNNGASFKIGRKFSTFFDMHMNLLDKFPNEGGQKNPSQRIIPFLPGKNLFARNHSREVTMKRLQSISEYCEELCSIEKLKMTILTNLPESISQCRLLKQFFSATEDDLTRYSRSESRGSSSSEQSLTISGPVEYEHYVAISSYSTKEKNHINLNEGEVVEVAEKNENGWWLVSNEYGCTGWVPGSYLEKSDGSKDELVTEHFQKGSGQCYKAAYDYTATTDDEISFPAGVEIEILEKNLEGWWLACYNGKEGWIPSSYLETNTQDQSENEPKHKLVQAPPKRSSIKRKPLGLELLKSSETKETRLYEATQNFDRDISGGVNFSIGQIVQVHEQSDNGWWIVEVNGMKGWAPSNYLKLKSDDSSSPRFSSASNRFTSSSPESSLSESLEQKQMEKEKNKFYSKLNSDLKFIPESSKASIEKPVEEYKWYFNIRREEAEQLLTKEQQEGYFIVRPSSKTNSSTPYSITLFHRHSILNFHIRRRSDGLFATGAYTEGEKTFPTVPKMIEFYRHHALVVGDVSNQVKFLGSPGL